MNRGLSARCLRTTTCKSGKWWLLLQFCYIHTLEESHLGPRGSVCSDLVLYCYYYCSGLTALWRSNTVVAGWEHLQRWRSRHAGARARASRCVVISRHAARAASLASAAAFTQTSLLVYLYSLRSSQQLKVDSSPAATSCVPRGAEYGSMQPETNALQKLQGQLPAAFHCVYFANLQQLVAYCAFHVNVKFCMHLRYPRKFQLCPTMWVLCTYAHV